MTKKLGKRQLMFAQGKAEGLSNEKAMIDAGYARIGAKQAATVLMKRKDIKVAIAKFKMNAGSPSAMDQFFASPEIAKVQIMQHKHYADPIKFLEDMVNNEKLSIGTRARAAEQLMPYKHARIGEKGKKENKKDDARDAAKGKFATKAPPALRVVR